MFAAFRQTIDRIAGTTQLQVTAGEPGFDEDVLEKVQSLPEVRAAAPVIEATVSTGKGNLLILGVDMLGDRSLRNYDLEGTDEAIDDPLVFLAQADSLIVTKTFADKNGLKINSRMPMRTMQGDQVFTVRGIMKPGGLASAFGGDLAIMDIYAAQKFFGRGRKFDRDRYRAARQRDPRSKATAKLHALLGPGLRSGTAQFARRAVRTDLAHLFAGVEHHQHVRAVHRDVHHLQHLRDRGDAAPLGDRNPARAGRDAFARSGRCSWSKA